MHEKRMRKSFTKCKDEGASVIEAWYTGEESESDMFDSSP